MKLSLMTICFFGSLMFTLFSAGCGDSPTEQPKQSDTDWKEVVQFRDVDIRYMVVHKGILYVSAIRSIPNSWKNINALLKTEDGIHWDTLKTFERWIGPIAFHGDTLTILEDGRTWKYHHLFGWVMFWQHLMTANLARDMIWLNNRLFVFENVYKMAFENNVCYELRNIPNSLVVSRFIKSNNNNKEIGITRPFYIYKDRVSVFDGSFFEDIMSGIPSSENILPNYPAMALHDNNIYAGFNSPCRIKKWVGHTWVNVSDTIPNTPSASLFNPNLSNRPTSIVFLNNKMYVGTEWMGVIEQTPSGWKQLANGLPMAFRDHPDLELYLAVIQMVNFKNSIFVAYGEPWSAPVVGGRGLYLYSQ